MFQVYLLLGSNSGDREENLSKAISLLNSNSINVLNCSSVYETEPWGYKDNSYYLNQALRIQTELLPHQFLKAIIDIEIKLGRVRTEKQWQARTLDIDILLYDDLKLNNPDLSIPHPLLHERKFALIPLNEIATDIIHPVLNKTIKVLMDECKDSCSVILYNKKGC